MDPAQRRPIDWIHSATTQAQLVRDYTVWDAEPPRPAAFVADVVRARQRALSAPQGPAYVSLDAGVQEARADGTAAAARPRPARPGTADGRRPRLRRPAPPSCWPAPSARSSWPAGWGSTRGRPRPWSPWSSCSAPPTATTATWSPSHSAHPQNATGDKDLLREADVVLAVDVVDLHALLAARSRGRPGRGGEQPRDRPLVIDLSHGDLGLRSWTNAFGSPRRAVDVQLLADPLLGLAQLTAALRVPRRRAPPPTARREAVCRAGGRPQGPPVGRGRGALGRHPHLARPPGRRDVAGRARRRPPALRAQHPHLARGRLEVPRAPAATSATPAAAGSATGRARFVGGALAARDRGQLGVGIIGDGDLLMAAGALWTAVHYRIPMLVVINDNCSFYNDEPHQAEVARHRGRPPENSWIGMRIADPLDRLRRAGPLLRLLGRRHRDRPREARAGARGRRRAGAGRRGRRRPRADGPAVSAADPTLFRGEEVLDPARTFLCVFDLLEHYRAGAEAAGAIPHVRRLADECRVARRRRRLGARRPPGRRPGLRPRADRPRRRAPGVRPGPPATDAPAARPGRPRLPHAAPSSASSPGTSTSRSTAGRRCTAPACTRPCAPAAPTR